MRRAPRLLAPVLALPLLAVPLLGQGSSTVGPRLALVDCHDGGSDAGAASSYGGGCTSPSPGSTSYQGSYSSPQPTDSPAPYRSPTYNTAPQQYQTSSPAPKQYQTSSPAPYRSPTYNTAPQQYQTYSSAPKQYQTSSAPKQYQTYSSAPKQYRTSAAAPQRSSAAQVPLPLRRRRGRATRVPPGRGLGPRRPRIVRVRRRAGGSPAQGRPTARLLPAAARARTGVRRVRRGRARRHARIEAPRSTCCPRSPASARQVRRSSELCSPWARRRRWRPGWRWRCWSGWSPLFAIDVPAPMCGPSSRRG